MTQIQHYLDKISSRHSSGKATEHSYRGDLQNLLESLLPDIAITNEPTRIQCGAPDYILSRHDLDIGWIEAKDIGKPLNSKDYKEQFDRYRAALDNLIITDYLQFDFYRSGEKVTSISLARLDDKKIHALPDNFQHFIDLIKDFSRYTGQSINSASLLSKMMAAKARLLANVIENALNSDEENAANSSLKDQLHAFKSVLLHDITPAEFADIYAQTIAYGLFAARLHDDTQSSFTRQQAAEKIPLSNPFLRKLFHYIAGFDLDARIVWIVDALADIFRAVNAIKIMKNFGNSTGQQDPIIHFYETFLAEYDPKLRKSRGVWYTPEPVVNFIVRAVDDLLKTDFKLNGLADTSKTTIEIDTPVLKGTGKNKTTSIEKRKTQVHQVQILDPATGTGTFLAAIVKHIYASEFESMQGAWSSYVEEHLIPRLNGFEILMASYAMAHLKLDLLLTETGYKPKKQPRFNIYLTNSLEKEHPDTGTLFTFARWLSDEANEANYIKRDTPVMVVMGNPPYSVSSSNKNDWILELISDYKKDLNEKNIQPLSDDYIKFIRYGSHFIEKNGAGILAYISNNSFIDGVIHRQMRKHLLETFDSIYILDLHGSNKKKETAPDGGKDENVFDIMQGVSINIFVKTNSNNRSPIASAIGESKKAEAFLLQPMAQVYHFDLYGSRKHKYEMLSANSLSSLAWNKIACRAPEYFFIAKDIEVQHEYNKFIKSNELFITFGSGIKFRKDNLLVKNNFSEIDVKNMVSDMQNLPKKDILEKYNFNETEDWNLEEQRQYFKICNSINIKKVYYRPFDYRFTFYPLDYISKIIPRGDSRKGLMQNFSQDDNLGLVLKRSRLLGGTFHYRHTAICNSLCDINFLADQSFVFPLYLYPETTAQQSTEETNHRTPNLNQKLVKQISENLGLTFTDEKETTANTFSPIDILDYIYAVLHSPNYRETYKEFLKSDFPRVPYPNINTFWQLVKLGGELRQLHLLERSTNLGLYASYPIDGDNVITRKLNKHDFEITDNENQRGRVWINNTQYFDNVPQTAWAFYIGGYQPAQKWLKDRHGRVLTIEDIKHYSKIINALIETARIMQEIDVIAVE
jgi:predicted helicase